MHDVANNVHERLGPCSNISLLSDLYIPLGVLAIVGGGAILLLSTSSCLRFAFRGDFTFTVPSEYTLPFTGNFRLRMHHMTNYVPYIHVHSRFAH